VIGALIGKSLAVKVVAGFAAMTVAGTGVAAETGALPAPVQQAAHDVAGGLGVPAPREVAEQPATGPTEEADATPSVAPSAIAEPTASKAPDRGPDASGPAARGLCQAYRSGANGNSVAQQALANAAGGADKVTGYCDGVLGSGTEKNGAGGSGKGPDKGSDAGSGNGTSGGTGGSDKGKGKDPGKGTGNGADKGTGTGGSDKGKGKDPGKGTGTDKGTGKGSDKGAGKGSG
jgi:hypothetical protein